MAKINFKIGDKLIHKNCKLSYEIIDMNDKYVTLKALHNFSFSPQGKITTYVIDYLKQFKLIKE